MKIKESLAVGIFAFFLAGFYAMQLGSDCTKQQGFRMALCV